MYDQGRNQYTLERKLQPDEQMWIDMAQLIRNRIPDRDGKLLPTDLSVGAYKLIEVEPKTLGSLFEGKVIIDKTFGHAAYGCMICCGVTQGQFDPDPWYGVVNQTGDEYIASQDACSGNAVTTTAYYPSWSTQNSGIATASQAQFTGVSGGSTNGLADGRIPWGDGGAYPPSRGCPVVRDTVQGPVNVRIPHQEDRVLPDPISTVNACGIGFAGKKRVITGIIADQWNVTFTADGVLLNEALSVSRNDLALPPPETGSTTTSSGGKFGDTFFFCSPNCPGNNGETDAVQNLFYGGVPVFLPNGLAYRCAGILWNNQ